MKSILLHIEDDPGLEARLQASLDLARAFDGHLTCLHSINYQIFAPGEFYGAAVAAAIPVIREAASELRAKVEADLANEDVKWEWQEHTGPSEYRLLEASALNDVVVVGANDGDRDDAGPSQMVSSLLVQARTPVLIIPRKLKSFDYSGAALVAWNGSTEASIALRAALPLLKGASSVTLVSVGESNDRKRFDLPAIDGAEYLSRHGVDCELLEVPRGDAGISETLFDLATERGCSYLVMGAYGHSRLAEMLLGGVTRSALANPRIPVFLAH